MAENIEEIKKSFHESVAVQMTAQLDSFAKNWNEKMDKRFELLERGMEQKSQNSARGNQGGNRGGKTRKNNFSNRAGNGNNDSAKSKIGSGNGSNTSAKQNNGAKNMGRPKSNFQSKKETKDAINISRTDGLAKQIQCECEIVVNCIPNFKGSFKEIQAHDLFEALKILQQVDKFVKKNEIKNIRRHPGSEKSKEEFIKVSVLFNNSETPARLALKAEVDDDFTKIQRSLPKDIRDRNMVTLNTMEDLNKKRPQNCPYLWSKTVVKGLIILIQIPDPLFREVPEQIKENPETAQVPAVPQPGTIHSAVEKTKELNEKLLATGNTPLSNLPDVCMEDYMEELEDEFGPLHKEMMEKVLLRAGMKSKSIKPKSKKKSKQETEDIEKRQLRGNGSRT